MGVWRTHEDTTLPGSFPGAVFPLLPACPLHGPSLGTSGRSPHCGVGRGSHGPKTGVVAPTRQQHAASLLHIFQQANVLFLVPAARPVPNSLLSDGGTPQPWEERKSTVCLKGERACAGHARRGPAVQAALAGTGTLCSTGKLDPSRAGGRGGADVRVAAIRVPLWRDKRSALPPPRRTLLCRWLWRARRGRELDGKLNWPDGNLLWRQPCWSGRRRHARCSQLLACVQSFHY